MCVVLPCGTHETPCGFQPGSSALVTVGDLSTPASAQLCKGICSATLPVLGRKFGRTPTPSPATAA
jgi:hypothetical protein